MDYFPSCNPNHPSMLTNGGRDTKNKTKRGNGAAMKLSTDPQSVAARERRHRISHRFKILQSLVPGGSSKMDTVSMLDQAIHYVKFLKTQIWLHQALLRRCVDDDPSMFLPTNSLLTQPDLFSLINVGSAQVHQVSQVAVPNCYIQDDQEPSHMIHP